MAEVEDGIPHRLYKNDSVPMPESSSPDSFFTGHSTFSAPGNLRTFFQRVLESMPAGSPDMTTVRMARGSDGAGGRG